MLQFRSFIIWIFPVTYICIEKSYKTRLFSWQDFQSDRTHLQGGEGLTTGYQLFAGADVGIVSALIL
jgi:hypothetical protein